MSRAVSFVILGLAIVVACGPSTTPSTPAPIASASAVSAPGVSPVTSPESAAAVDAALTDAASHLGVSRDALRVDQVESREWPDSSLGCPQPGQLYLQVVTPGFLIVISSGSRLLEYHSDDHTRVVLCKET